MATHALKFSFLLIAAYILCPVVCQRDYTYTDLANGQDVTEAVARRISDSQIFPDDHSFLIRLAYVESRFGTHNSTFRANYTGGIWQVDEAYYNKTLNHTALGEYYIKIRDIFDFNWTATTTWRSCLAPMYSGLAAALYFAQLPEPIPDKLSEQAAHWKKYYRPDGDVADFIKDSNDLRNETVCRGKMDLAIVLDGSGSIGDQDFIKAKNFAAEMIESFTLDFTRLGMLVYSDTTTPTFELNNTLTIAQMAQRARNARYPLGGTRTDLGILRAIRMHNETTTIDGIPRIVAVLTDGKNTGNDLPGAVDQLARNKFVSIAIGIGSGIDYAELRLIALDNPRRVFPISDFEALQDFLYELTSLTCEIPQTPAVNGSYEDSLVAKEKRLYELQVPEAGLTINLPVTAGSLVSYWSRTERVPSSAVHDGMIYQPTFIPFDDAASNVYISVKGLEAMNDYTFLAIEGGQDNPDPTEETTEPGIPSTTAYPECPTPEPEPCNCCDRCPQKQPQEIHHHHYYHSAPNEGDQCSFPS